MGARKTFVFSTEELIDAPVQRKHLDIEWLTKLSSAEFLEWSRACRMIFTMRENKPDEVQVEKMLWEEIERKEKQYQLTKEKQRLEKKLRIHKTMLARFEKDYKNDVLYKINTYDIVPVPGYKKACGTGLHKSDKMIELGGDIISCDPYIPIVTGTTKQNRVDDFYKVI